MGTMIIFLNGVQKKVAVKQLDEKKILKSVYTKHNFQMYWGQE